MYGTINSIGLRQKYVVGAYPLTVFGSGLQKRGETSNVVPARNSHPGVLSVNRT